MALGKIEIKANVLQSKLKIAHKHLGNLIDEWESACFNCGSTHTTITKIHGDGEIKYKVKKCNDCGEGEFIEVLKE